MNQTIRKKMVLAMEFIACQINDEEIFDRWLMGGVADGDIPYGSVDIENVDDYYTSDKNFKDLMDCFLDKMFRAYSSGGLYCDKIESTERPEPFAEKQKAILLTYLQSQMDDMQKNKERYGADDRIVRAKCEAMIACKEMAESIIGEPVNLGLNGIVTIGL